MSEILLVQLLIITALITLSFKLLPLFVKLPENNPFVNKFFEALPYTVLVLLIFPDIFTSTGTGIFGLVKVFAGIGVIVYFSLKKMELGGVILVSMVTILAFDIVKLLLRM